MRKTLLPFVACDRKAAILRVQIWSVHESDVVGVIPGIITGTFENPKFKPDTEQFTLMRLKGIVPTSDNPFGVLGPLLGQHNNQNETKQPSQNLFKGINKFGTFQIPVDSFDETPGGGMVMIAMK